MAQLEGQDVANVNQIGTTVSIEIPLSRRDQKHAAEHSSLRIPAEAGHLSLPGKHLTVGFIGFRSDGRSKSPVFEGRDGSIKENIRKSVANCLVDWLQMEPFPESDAHVQEADYVVILVDDRIKEFIQPFVDDVQKQQPRVIALLASEMSRRDVEDTLGQSIHAFEIMSAPFGPRKMARAVAACEQAAASWHGHYRRPPPSDTLEKLKAVQTDLDVGSYLLERNGLVLPPKVDAEPVRSHSQPVKALKNTDALQPNERPSASEETTRPPAAPESLPTPCPPLKPRLLLVDDNAINLCLLETYVRKRGHEYSCAENGLRAVEAFHEAQPKQQKQQQQRQAGASSYDIVFMDISMPVMDGLEATREIRRLEQVQRSPHQHEREQEVNGRRESNNDGALPRPLSPPPPPPPALIIALTGLANSQDQANAFASGVDLFMTKPVRFREIGRVLDDWAVRVEGSGLGTGQINC
jgi:CheY-like chemotaxis protein